MTGFGYLFTLVASGLMYYLPRRWVPLAFLIGATYISVDQQIEVGPLHFPVIRILVAVGILRVVVKGERIVGGWNMLDRMMLFWAGWNICCIPLHKPSVQIFRLGILYDALGLYFLFRIFIQGLEDIRTVFRMVCIVLLPLAATMLVERLKGINPLFLMGLSEVQPENRNGYFRAQGAFSHSILAGTVGAVCLPMAIYFWRQARTLAFAGMAATLIIVYASGSSGPIMTTLSVLGALALWGIRDRLQAIRWLALFLILALDIAMNDPVYFILARIDITGGSTGYFRAQLIRSAIEHLSEWWLIGTDYTRHWMPSGIAANPDHTDMTNYFLAMGVWGGIPLLMLFFGVVFAAFGIVGKALRRQKKASFEQQFIIWTLGAVLFGHATTFVSISYFDQTVVFFYLALGCIGSLQTLKPAFLQVRCEDGTWVRQVPEPRVSASQTERFGLIK